MPSSEGNVIHAYESPGRVKDRPVSTPKVNRHVRVREVGPDKKNVRAVRAPYALSAAYAACALCARSVVVVVGAIYVRIVCAHLSLIHI